MSIAPNPIVSGGAAKLLLSEHARFRMAERDVDQSIVEELRTAPMADFSVDEKSGNLVFRIRNFSVVAKRLESSQYLILSLFTDDQKLG